MLCTDRNFKLLMNKSGGLPSPPVPGPLAWWGASDPAYVKQVSDGTGAAAIGSPIGMFVDKLGGTNHLIQATAGSRPTLRQDGANKYYAEFDGVDDTLAANIAALRLLGDLTICIACFKTTAISIDPLVNCSTNVATINPYTLEFNAHATVAQPWFFAADNATLETDAAGAPSTGAVNTPLIISARRSIGVSVEISCNGVRDVLAHTMVPTSDANSITRLGARPGGGDFLGGGIYEVLIYGTRLSDPNLTLVEAFLDGLS